MPSQDFVLMAKLVSQIYGRSDAGKFVISFIRRGRDNINVLENNIGGFNQNEPLRYQFCLISQEKLFPCSSVKSCTMLLVDKRANVPMKEQ